MHGSFSFLMVALLLAGCSKHYGNLAEREAYWQSLSAAELRPGVARAQVEAFFAKHGLEHSYDERSRLLRGIERDVAGDLLVSFSITFSCQFNSANALVACPISRIGTGP
jgi:hypothetical protein